MYLNSRCTLREASSSFTSAVFTIVGQHHKQILCTDPHLKFCSSILSWFEPTGLAFFDHYLYATSANCHQIFRFNLSSGVSEIFVGNPEPGWLDGHGQDAYFNGPIGLTFDPNGNLFVADFLNHCIRCVNPKRQVQTLALTRIAQSSELPFSPYGLCFDTHFNVLYATDSSGHSVWKITGSKLLSCLYQNPSPSSASSSTLSRHHTLPPLQSPSHMALSYHPKQTGLLVASATGIFYIPRTYPDHPVELLVGLGVRGFQDGNQRQARFKSPHGLLVDSTNQIFVADSFNNAIRNIIQDSTDAQKFTVGTVAGERGKSGYRDGISQTELWQPGPMCFGQSQDVIFVGDSRNNCIRVILLDSVPFTVLPSSTLTHDLFLLFRH